MPAKILPIDIANPGGTTSNHYPAVQRLGELVHFVDVGGIAVDEAPGLELLVRGLQAQHTGDDDLLTAALPLFNTLYAALVTTP